MNPDFNTKNLTADDVISIIPANPRLAAEICMSVSFSKRNGNQRFSNGISTFNVDYIPNLLSREEVKEINGKYTKDYEDGTTDGMQWCDEDENGNDLPARRYIIRTSDGKFMKMEGKETDRKEEATIFTNCYRAWTSKNFLEKSYGVYLRVEECK